MNWDLQKIMRNYLVDFWRHEVEKNEGGRRLWEQITGTSVGANNTWWTDEQSKDDNKEGVKKTRWQVVAEQLFCSLLGIGDFSCQQQINLLLQLRERSGKRKDTELMNIIDNYISSTC